MGPIRNNSGFGGGGKRLPNNALQLTLDPSLAFAGAKSGAASSATELCS